MAPPVRGSPIRDAMPARAPPEVVVQPANKWLLMG